MTNQAFPPRSGLDVSMVDTEIEVQNGYWTFSNGVANSFVSHVRKSVPLYDEGHFMAAELASCFLLPKGKAYELGVSTGELIKKLARHNPRTRSVKWIGLDCESEMIAKAREHCAGIDNIELIEANLEDFEFDKCDFVVDFLTTQFLNRSAKRALFRKIYESLREGEHFLHTRKYFSRMPFFKNLHCYFTHDLKPLTG